MIHPKIFFEILHAIAPLCLEKSDGVQFLKKKLLLLQNGSFLPQFGPKKLNCFVHGIYSHDFCKLCMIKRHYSYIKNIEWNSPNYVLFE